ncbi:MAG: hypothetical protein RBU30_16335 [Polyangia bacterium]|jgi:hypothetical protein|nr:hypothetical protein [Polyangia bacterium]
MSEESKDEFKGDEALLLFSAKLAAGEPVSDEEVVGALGTELLEAFRFVEQKLLGYVRKVTGEPILAHSVDLALRAFHLGYPPTCALVGLLHDTVEDTSSSLEEVAHNLGEIGLLFGDAVARDVRVLTNRYSMILEGAGARLPGELPFEPTSLSLVREAIDQFQMALPALTRQEFAKDIYFLTDHFLGRLLEGVDLERCQRRARQDRKYTLVNVLKLQAYNVYLAEIADDARIRLSGLGAQFFERAIVVKGLDVVDNNRTAALSMLDLDKTLRKAEIWLDRCYYLLDHLRRNGLGETTSFECLYDYVKVQVVEQASERGRALARLADSRFKLLAGFLVEQISRLQQKYKVEPDPIAQLARLTGRIQARNRALLQGPALG